ncbi:2503_t:CDS:2 [Racocetra fulgida]|uniref:2503_t:CDS:1 n=1 Tax=Racocetra fulgida TaxID=60492 RepID=A0A9N9AYT9_9GLOM|nr:2503_t:CDS:2 [Racocetra fulgida]
MDRSHDVHLAIDILSKNLRPLITDSIPKFYENIMKQCWDKDPSKRPDATKLVSLFDEIIELSKDIDKSQTLIMLNNLQQISKKVVKLEEFEKDEAGTLLNQSLLDHSFTRNEF